MARLGSWRQRRPFGYHLFFTDRSDLFISMILWSMGLRGVDGVNKVELRMEEGALELFASAYGSGAECGRSVLAGDMADPRHRAAGTLT